MSYRKNSYGKRSSGIPAVLFLLGVLLLCTLYAASKWFTPISMEGNEPELVLTEEAEEEIPVILASYNFLALTEPHPSDHILELYRQPETRNCVIEFFSGICGSPEIAEIILTSTDSFNISPSLVFALCWEESHFDPQAVNNANRNGSVDRGLFQLNNLSFPKLETSAFFDPEVNAKNAIQYLSSCMKTCGNEVGALAMYNAGIGRINKMGAPWDTLDYISRILENLERIQSHFMEWESCWQRRCDRH
uniref:Transglycosylase SLT domain-containing protein n=1 Tax=uncultured bacterium contig00014 TaxID=1181505 RepID=A0A806K1C4_9BACT|nr:hypothetical protein [uncultured bacterium contig00014]